MGAKANIMEQSFKNKRKNNGGGPSQGFNGSKRFNGKCYNYGKNEHHVNDCRSQITQGSKNHKQM